MGRRNLTSTAILGFAASIAPAVGQSINFSFSDNAFASPSASYSAAGLPGRWNVSPAEHLVTYGNFRKLDGSGATGVTLRNIGGLDMETVDNPQTTGDDEKLMDDYLVTYNPNLETCIFFNGLENGDYQVISYAWIPDQPTEDSYVTVDFADQGGAFVSGIWPGTQQEGMTYAVHTVTVTDGTLNMHSGIPPSETGKAALNGLQIRKISTLNPMDADGDNDLDDADLHALTTCITGPRNAQMGPVCDGFDHDENGTVDLVDYAEAQRVFSQN